MPISVISTVGNSIFRNAGKSVQQTSGEFGKRTDIAPNSVLKEKHDFPGKGIYDQIMVQLETAAAADDRTTLIGASAELNSLINIFEAQNATGKGHRLDFLVSDTPDGALAGRVVGDFCETYFEAEVHVYVIEGLQVKDETLFRRTGALDLISRVYRILKETPKGTYTCIFNPTGGYKAAVPYLTMIGMLEGVQLNYIFEQSNVLMQLGNLPVRLSYDDIQVPFETLVELEANSLTESELKKALGIENGAIVDHAAWPLFDAIEDDGQMEYDLSGLGRVALEHFKRRNQTEVWLSAQAAEKLRASSGQRRKSYESILNDIHDPQSRKNHFHKYPNLVNAPVYKPGDTAERAFYLDEGDHILVLELAFHINATDYDVVPQRRKDYGRFERWERTDRSKKANP